MSDYPEIAERFAKDTAEHKMFIRQDQGLYRHIRFQKPKSGSYWFDLITVPHALIFRGDGESFVFDRLPDMFEFFRSGIWEDGSLHINPHYWAEKLTSDRDCVMRYDQDLFERQVKEHVAQEIVDRTAPRGISRAIKELFEEGDITWEGGARRALEEFQYCRYEATCACGAAEAFSDELDASSWRYDHPREAESGVRHRVTVTPGEVFRFEDTWEWDFKDYHWWFLWACQAIVWGIQQYDAAKAAEKAQVAS
jgi:hypothetical protein